MFVVLLLPSGLAVFNRTSAALLSSVCVCVCVRACLYVQPEELTLTLIKLRRQQAELNSLREHTVAQLMALSLEGPNAKVSTLCSQQVWGCACVCASAGEVVHVASKCKCLCVFVGIPNDSR